MARDPTEAYDELAPSYGLNGGSPRPTTERAAPAQSAQPAGKGKTEALRQEINESPEQATEERPPAASEPDPVSSSGNWPTPTNILRDLEAPPLDPAELPGILGEFAAAFADTSGIDPGAVLVPALVSFAALLDDRFSIIGDSRTGWLQSARLWSLVIAPPGAGKTPGLRAALRPSWELQRELLAEYQQAVEAARLTPGWAGTDDENYPKRPRIIVADSTIEALAVALKENPRGFLYATDEFESLMGSLDLYRRGSSGSRDRGEWLRLFDGGPHTIERIQRGSTYIPNFGVSIVTATTPAALAKMSKALPEDGLLQRFLVYSARRIVPTNAAAPPSAETVTAAYNALQRNVYKMVPRAHNGACALSHDAGEALQEFRWRNGLQVEAVYPAQPALAGHLAKHPALLLRVALTLHAMQIAGLKDERARDPASWPVSLDTLATAERLLHRLTRHAVAVYTRLTGDTGSYALARDVARYILGKLPENLERRHLVQSVNAFRGSEERDQAEALRLLEDLGWLRALPDVGYRKAMPTHYAVSPRLAAEFSALAERERAMREARRELLRERVEDRRRDQ